MTLLQGHEDHGHDGDGRCVEWRNGKLVTSFPPGNVRTEAAERIAWGQHGGHSTDVVGYTYDADVHCPIDAVLRFGVTAEGWVPESARDSEGNGVHPIFADQARDQVFIGEPEFCADCGERLVGG